MTDREKLAELLASYYGVDPAYYGVDAYAIADHFLAAGVTFKTWIPVSERLPDRMMQCVCQYVFGDNTEYPFYAVMWYFAKDKVPHFQNEGSLGLRVTHWMPLPEPPEH